MYRYCIYANKTDRCIGQLSPAVVRLAGVQAGMVSPAFRYMQGKPATAFRWLQGQPAALRLL